MVPHTTLGVGFGLEPIRCRSLLEGAGLCDKSRLWNDETAGALTPVDFVCAVSHRVSRCRSAGVSC
jgi:hypothetical protein